MIRVYATAQLIGLDRSMKAYYEGSWEPCTAAVEAIKARARGDVRISENRPGEIRIIFEAEGDVYQALGVAIQALEALLDGHATLFSLDSEYIEAQAVT